MKKQKGKKKKRVGVKYLDKRKYCVGTEPSMYIGILVTSTTTGPGGSVALQQAKGRWFNPQLWQEFFFPQAFFYLPFQPLIYIRPNGNGLSICPSK